MKRLKKENKTSAKKLASNYAYKARKSKDPEWVSKNKEYMRAYRDKNIDRLQEHGRQYTKDVWEKFSVEYRLRRLGLSETLAEDVRSHCGLCDICNKEPNGRWKQLSIDHCHDSGEFRGMLCDSCNRGLGFFQHDVEILRKALQYLEKSNKNSS